MNRDRGLHLKGRRLAAVAILFVSIAVKIPELRAQAAQNSETAKPRSSAAGQQLFSSTCAGCHGLDGKGGEHAPNIATNSDIQMLGDAALIHIVRNGIPAADMPGFGGSFNDAQLNAVVGYLRTLQGKGQTASIAGNPEHGRVLFFGGEQCSRCHMVGGQGGFIGADLTGYGGTHSASEIREAIIDPNKNIDPRHGTVTVVTRDGRKYTGVARNEDNFSLQMQTADGAFHLFDKANLMRVNHEARSLMPSQYGTTFSPSDLDDLVSYLAKGAAPQASRMRDDEEE